MVQTTKEMLRYVLLHVHVDAGGTFQDEPSLSKFSNFYPTNFTIHDHFPGFFLKNTKKKWGLIIFPHHETNFAPGTHHDDPGSGNYLYWS